MSEPREDETAPDSVVLTERRGAFDLVMALLTGACLVAAARGADRAPTLAIGCAILAVALVGVWVQRRRRPAAQLLISREVIALRRGDLVEAEGRRAPGAWVRITRSRSGAYLSVQGVPHAVVDLMGFDLRDVAYACRRCGWVVGSELPGAEGRR